MATKTSKAIQPTNNSDANFRAWTKFLFDAMIAGGWVQTADTGQINFTTVTKPTAANQSKGYFIVRMADTLQSTAPIYVRVDVGGSNSADHMGVWLTIGSGSDGAGAITNKYFENAASSTPIIRAASQSGSIANPMSFVSAGTNRVHACIGLDTGAAGQAQAIFFSLERTVSGSGEPTAEGVILYNSDNGSTIDRMRYIDASQKLKIVHNGLPHIHSLQNPSANSHNVGGSIVFPMDGLAQQPALGVLAYRGGDWQPQSRLLVEIYGQTIPYQTLITFKITYEQQDTNANVLMRFD